MDETVAKIMGLGKYSHDFAEQVEAHIKKDLELKEGQDVREKEQRD